MIILTPSRQPTYTVLVHERVVRNGMQIDDATELYKRLAPNLLGVVIEQEDVTCLRRVV